MNEEIDLTISKIFLRELDNGMRAYLDDEHAYLIKYGEEGSDLSDSKTSIFAFLSSGREGFFKGEERDFREECEVAKETILDIPYRWNYPMGMGDNCDCCGVELNLLNRSWYAICEICDDHLEKTAEGGELEL